MYGVERQSCQPFNTAIGESNIWMNTGIKRGSKGVSHEA